MKLVRNGHSWSGNERNRFFRNSADGYFHEMSHLAGLDQAEDGRALAIVDWDQDGRLDLWYRNRNAPRLRFMRNERDTGSALFIKLEGTRSNRDGIGAVVELLPTKKEGAKEERLIRSVRAGDLFLSQSSKWLHFGTGKNEHPRSAHVIWPGGVIEEFKNLPSKGRILLKEGSAKAIPLPARSAITLPLKTSPIALRDDGKAHIILPARVPFPDLRYQNGAGIEQKTTLPRAPRLLYLWSAHCSHCRKTLPLLASQASAFRAAQLSILALSVDSDQEKARALIKSSAFLDPSGSLHPAALTQLADFQAQLFDRTPASTVPLAILLDENNQALAIYRGPIPPETILADWTTLRSAHPTQLYHLAPPLKGTWFTNPLPPREVHRLYPPSISK